MLRDEGYALDMLLAARAAAEFLGTSDAAGLEADPLRLSAVVYQLQIIGAAASKISQEYRAAHREVDWEHIVGMRHVLVHDYRIVDARLVWHAAAVDAPELCGLLERFIPAEEDLG